MAVRVRLEFASLLAEAQSFRTEGNQFEESIERMDRLTDELSSIWEGEAAVAYTEKYQQLRPNLLACRALIEEIATALEKVSAQVAEADTQIAGAFK